MFLKIIIILAGSYLLGSIVTSDIVTWFKKVDLRKQGSGNVGATNAFRVMGSFYGIVVLLGDALKGIIAIFDWKMAQPFSQLRLGNYSRSLGHHWA